MNPDFDDYDDVTREENSSPIKSRSLPRLVLFIAIAGFLGLTYYAYHTGTQSVETGQVPYVKADESEIKSAPQDTGGEEFANKDKTIYDAISPYTAPTGKKVEKLLPEPEEPKMPLTGQSNTNESEVFDNVEAVSSFVKKESGDALQNAPQNAPQNVSQNVSQNVQEIADDAETKSNALKDSIENAIKNNASPLQEEPKKASVAIEKTASIAKKEEIAKPAPTPIPALTAAPNPAPTLAAQKPAATASVAIKPVVAKPAPATGNYKIQLGAFQSETEAKTIWQRTRSKNADILRGKSYVIVKALLTNGTYYRLRASGFASADAAKAACVTLTSRKQPCFFAGQ